MKHVQKAEQHWQQYRALAVVATAHLVPKRLLACSVAAAGLSACNSSRHVTNYNVAHLSPRLSAHLSARLVTCVSAGHDQLQQRTLPHG